MSEEHKDVKECVNGLVASQAVQTDRLLAIDKKLDRCVTALHGTVTAPEKGMVVRVDRLEQSKTNIVRGLWVVLAGFISHTVATFWK